MAELALKTKVSIKAEPSEVFFYLSTLKYHYLWNPTLRKLSTETDLREGMTYKSESKVLGGISVTSHNKITRLVPNKELRLENRFGSVNYDITITLSKRGPRTNVTCKTFITTKVQFLGFTNKVLNQLASRELQTDLDYLKLAVEHDMAQTAKN